MYKSPEDTPCMINYRAVMRECIRTNDCLPVKHNCPTSPNGGGNAMMGRGGFGGGGGRHGGHGGFHGHGGFRRGFSRGFRRGWPGGSWGGYPVYYEGYLSPCDIDPDSYECFLWLRSRNRGINVVLGNSLDYYSRVQAWNLLPRLFPFPR